MLFNFKLTNCFAPTHAGTSTERKPYLIPRDGQIETMLAVQGLEEILLARYMPPPPPEVIKPK